MDELDLIWGCEGIAKAIGKSARATFHILEQNQIPAKKVGRQWVASRRKLREHFEGVEDVTTDGSGH
jgi:hypothetical protein